MGLPAPGADPFAERLMVLNAQVTYEEALLRVLEAAAAAGPVGQERVPLEESCGRVLAETVCALGDVPPFDRSPYDGYAFRAEDTEGATPERPADLRILEEIPAGGVPRFHVGPGTAAKILTGAPIPEGADAVVPWEDTVFTKTQVSLSHSVAPGSNIVRAGEDVKQGSVLARRGQVLDPGLLGTLAAQGRGDAAVFRKPAVGLISTGSELVPPGTGCPPPGKIYDSNRYTLGGTLTALGCIPVGFGIPEDDANAIAAVLEQALQRCDAVVLTGGVSVGDYDRTVQAMEAAGARILFHGCRMKPGTACAYGVWRDKLICALSGNPAAAFVNFSLIARPALWKLCGREAYLPQTFPVTLADPFPKKSPTMRILRGSLDLSQGTAQMRLPRDQGNAVLHSAIGCNLMAIVPAGSGPLSPGTQLEGIML